MIAVGVGQAREDRLQVLVVLHHAGPHRVARRRRRGPDVHRLHQRHLLGPPRVPGRGELLAIGGHALAQQGQRGGRRARVDRQPQLRDVGEALRRVHRDPDGRVRALERLRHHREVLDLVEPPVVAEAVLRPGQADDVEALGEAGAVLSDRDPEAVELGGNGAAAHPELEAAAREDVRGGRLLRAGERLVQRQQRHRGADANALGALGDRGHRHERGGQQGEGGAEVDLGEPGHVEPERVGERGQLEHLGEALGVALAGPLRRLEEEAESHRAPGSQTRPSGQPSHSQTPRPITYSRSSPLSHGRCWVKSVMHS